MGREDMKYPRIWDRYVEREIVGETKVSWLVKQPHTSEAVKVNKRKPNGDKPELHAQWFFDESQQQLVVWACTNFHRVKETLGRHSCNVSPEVLHRVAEAIGYYPTLNSSQPSRNGK